MVIAVKSIPDIGMLIYPQYTADRGGIFCVKLNLLQDIHLNTFREMLSTGLCM